MQKAPSNTDEQTTNKSQPQPQPQSIPKPINRSLLEEIRSVNAKDILRKTQDLSGDKSLIQKEEIKEQPDMLRRRQFIFDESSSDSSDIDMSD